MTSKQLERLDDQEVLMLIAKNQDKTALSELYERYRHTLGSFLRRKLFDEKLADEVYNDVMLTVWQKASNFRGDSKVSTWIFGIGYRTCLSRSRKERKHAVNVGDFELDSISVPADSDEVEQLRGAISGLSDDHRTVVEMAYFYGHSLIEIAEVMDCPLNTVKTRLFHARKNLKDILEKQDKKIAALGR